MLFCLPALAFRGNIPRDYRNPVLDRYRHLLLSLFYFLYLLYFLLLAASLSV
jgi:hypothetical protein